MPTILMTDDAELIGCLAGSFVRREGIQVVPVHSAREAIDRARERAAAGTPVDVALLDAESGGGLEACGSWHSGLQAAQVATLLVGPGRLREAAAAARAEEFLPRPLNREVLLASLRRHLPLRERENERVPVNLKVNCRTAEGSFIAFSHDLSRGGMFLKMTRAPRAGSRILLAFDLPGDRALAVEAEAEVVREIRPGERVRVPGVGLMFTSVPVGTKLAIGRFVREGAHA